MWSGLGNRLRGLIGRDSSVSRRGGFHDFRGIHLLETLLQDTGFAVRLFLKTPLISGLALLSLALGIGANTAIFSLIDAVLLRTLPVQNPEQLAQVRFRSPRSQDPRGTFTNPFWEQLRDRQDVFSGAFAWSPQDFDLSESGESRRVRGIYASGGYFTTLGVRPALGRLFDPGDDKRGCSGAVVLGYSFWQRYYGGAERAVGSTLRLNGQSFPVIGVTQPGFFGTDVGDRFDVALPICAEAVLSGQGSMLDARSAWWLLAMGRLRPGLSLEQANARLALLSPATVEPVVPEEWPPNMQEEFRHFTLTAVPAATGLTGFSGVRDRYRRPLEILMILVGLVLLIACSNIASLMLARSIARQREIAMRLSLGGSRRRLIRQLLTEGLVLSGAGALLGLLFARWGGAVLVDYVSTSGNRLYFDLSLDGRVLAFTIGITLLTGLIFSIAPAFRATRVSLVTAMKGIGAAPGESHTHFRTGRWILTAQLALSLILLVGAVLFVQSFRNLVTSDPGFDPSNVLLVGIDTGRTGLEGDALAALHSSVLARIRALPGVVSAGQHFISPMSGFEWNGSVEVPGYTFPEGEAPLVWFNAVTPGYFRTLRTPLLRGRDFDSSDTEESPRVAIINETLARRFFPDRDPLGETLRLGDSGPNASRPARIVGLVRDSKYLSLREEPLPFAYFPFSQVSIPFSSSSFAIRTTGRPESLVAAVREAVSGASADVSFHFITLAQQVDDTLVQERLLATLSGFFGILAALLTGIGVYGVMAYAVTQRTREIGIRMALGAGRGWILRSVLRDVLLLISVGTALGAIGAFWVTRFVRSLLFGSGVQGVEALGVAVGLLVLAAFLASYLPTRRAMRINPVNALRYE